jgi:cephalosporin hydroxylase
MGVRAAKNPFDSWIYQEILFQVQPDILVEVGSLEGGSTLFFAQLMDLIGKGAVVSVDKDRSNFQIKHPRVTAITGDSSSSEVVRQVSQICAGKSVLVVHDADHRKEQVLMDLSNYSRLVTIGSYLIVEDGIIDLFTPGDGIATFEEGPLSAIEEFLKLNSDFVIDKNCERYILTYNPNGFLKRIR